MEKSTNKKKYFQVYESLREYIKNNLTVGDKLPTENELCKQMGVSRNVLREAIKSLEITGTILSKPGVGMVIREFNSDFFISTLFSRGNLDSLENTDVIQCIEEVRKVLEIGFSEQAFASIGEEEIEKLYNVVKTMRKIRDKHHLNIQPFGLDMAKADAEFHSVLFSKVNNPLLINIIDSFWAYSRYYEEKASPQQINVTVNKHERILNALQANDYLSFRKALEYHFTNKNNHTNKG